MGYCELSAPFDSLAYGETEGAVVNCTKRYINVKMVIVKGHKPKLSLNDPRRWSDGD